MPRPGPFRSDPRGLARQRRRGAIRTAARTLGGPQPHEAGGPAVPRLVPLRALVPPAPRPRLPGSPRCGRRRARARPVLRHGHHTGGVQEGWDRLGGAGAESDGALRELGEGGLVRGSGRARSLRGRSRGGRGFDPREPGARRMERPAAGLRRRGRCAHAPRARPPAGAAAPEELDKPGAAAQDPSSFSMRWIAAREIAAAGPSPRVLPPSATAAGWPWPRRS